MVSKLTFGKYITLTLILMSISYVSNAQQSDTALYLGKEYPNSNDESRFPGGYDSLVKFIDSNLVCPPKASKQRIQGAVHVGFVVNKNGVVESVEILKGISKECDEEALRVIKLLPRFKGGVSANMKTVVRFECPK